MHTHSPGALSVIVTNVLARAPANTSMHQILSDRRKYGKSTNTNTTEQQEDWHTTDKLTYLLRVPSYAIILAVVVGMLEIMKFPAGDAYLMAHILVGAGDWAGCAHPSCARSLLPLHFCVYILGACDCHRKRMPLRRRRQQRRRR